MTDITSILRAAGSLLRDPANRLTHRYAETANGEPTIGTDPLAVKFCLVGALERAVGYTPQIMEARTACAVAIGHDNRYVAAAWDDATDEGREEIVQKLLAYQGPAE